MTVQDRGQTVLLEIQFFDRRPEIHEAHLLAYLNLLDLIRQSSISLIGNLCASEKGTKPGPAYAEVNWERASDLAKRNLLARKVLDELGLWKLFV